MRHRKAGIKLNRTSSHRDAMFRNMVTSLFKYDRLETTDAKAKELRRWADHMITLAKRGDLHARRQAMSIIREKSVVHKLFEEAAQRFGQTAGGYTRIVKLGRRKGDAAPFSMIELISVEQKPKKKKKKKKASEAQATPAEKRVAVPPPENKAETAPEAGDGEGSEPEPAAEAASAEPAAEDAADSEKKAADTEAPEKGE
jgi:large subunit ribosomal protein L17